MALINAVRKDNKMEEFDYNGLDKAGDKYVSLSYGWEFPCAAPADECCVR